MIHVIDGRVTYDAKEKKNRARERETKKKLKKAELFKGHVQLTKNFLRNQSMWHFVG